MFSSNILSTVSSRMLTRWSSGAGGGGLGTTAGVWGRLLVSNNNKWSTISSTPIRAFSKASGTNDETVSECPLEKCLCACERT
jgi:hypothetical protein